MTLVRRAGVLSLSIGVAIALTGCIATPLSTPDMPTASPGPTQINSGLELDRSLRAGQHQPSFGRLLAATQSGGVMTIQVQLEQITGAVIAVFVCSGEMAGPSVTLRRGGKTLLRVWTDGCDQSKLYSGQSEPIGQGGPAELVVAAPDGVRFALVLEEVA